MFATDLFATPPQRVFTLDAGRPFLADLAASVIASLGDDPFALADALILIPTRRAARGLNDAFADRLAGEGATLLPKIRPLGDLEDDANAFAGAAADDADLPPAISPMGRIAVLAQLINTRNNSIARAEKDDRAGDDFGDFGHGLRKGAWTDNWPAAIAAARELAKLIDSFYTEGVPFSALEKAAPDVYAKHWALSLDFLSVVTEAWPAFLADNGAMDPTERRIALIDRQRARWDDNPPDHAVIVAGTTGSAPAVARLARTVSGMPKGAVVLPGLDADLDERGWRAIDDPHPQSGLKAFLKVLEIEPRDVRRLTPAPRLDDNAGARRRLSSVALRPAEATDDWRELADALKRTGAVGRALDGLKAFEAETEDEEAQAIALAFRETLETPGRTAMLVTPDRQLARRVALKMRRWGVALDDSAGAPFAETPCGVYLRLVAAWRAAPSDPAAILSLVDHPLARFGLSPSARADAAAALDEGLRGVAPVTDNHEPLAGVRRKLSLSGTRDRLAERAAPILSQLESALDGGAPATFADQLDAHIRTAEMLSTDQQPDRGGAAAKDPAGETVDGASLLWRGGDGVAGARLVEAIRAVSSFFEGGGRRGENDYPQIFDALIANEVVRTPYDGHPRLAILGPLEARLQSADLVTLGGLNEGVWPSDAETDPFLSRPMRRAIGLPSPERRLGLATHDFAQLLANRDVLLTRSRQRDGAPAKPSRWLVRLENILAGAGATNAAWRSAAIGQWLAALDNPGPPRPVAAPAPRPPVAARPRDLYVTRIEKWLRDPYALYARSILKLRKLDEPGARFAARELGSLLHKIFEIAAREQSEDVQIDQLWNHWRVHAMDFGLSQAEFGYWRESVDRAFRWFADFESARRQEGAPVVIEGDGAMRISIDGAAPFTVRAKADRIDRNGDGRLELFDYKSGQPPSDKQDRKFSPQLPLTARIAGLGGFDGVAAAPIAAYTYLRILNRSMDDAKNATRRSGAEASEAAEEAEKRLRELVIKFDDPMTPYLSQPHPEFNDDYGDYDQLARRGEWAAYAEQAAET